ncbi:MAG: hypothetical protein KDB00_00860 [Planctomycetales bacterium]|nr:hypothetical protein [Planctomycetales bacterium]
MAIGRSQHSSSTYEFDSETQVVTQFAVIQTRFETIELETLVGVLTRQGHITHADARRVARRSRGILWENFGKEQANTVCKQLTELGYGVRVIPSAELPDLPEPRIIRWFELKETHLNIPDGIRGETVPMEWMSIFVISVGQIANLKKKMVKDRSRLVSSFDKAAFLTVSEPPTYRVQGNLVDVVDIVGLDQTGAIRHLRMPSNELAYSRIMGEGTELSRFERFLVIVEYLIAHATEAIVSPETRKILVKREPQSVVIEGDGANRIQEDALQTYNRWLLGQAITRERQLDQQENIGEVRAPSSE